jgi:1,2-diacylglycerol 3-alpha-glucosyltransferase
MKILFIIDQYDSGNNGTTITTQRMTAQLRAFGHEVRVVATGKDAKDKYTVAEIPLPILASTLIHKQGMTFAVPDQAVLEEAIAWADIVHFVLPFFLARRGLTIARAQGVPVTAAFHVQPENITYSLGAGRIQRINDWIFDLTRDRFYNGIPHLQVPSAFMKRQLVEHGYTNAIHVISNGVDPDFHYRKAPKTGAFRGKFVILMVGRYSNEKRQDVLIEAVRQSRYAGMIQLVLAGKGPKDRKLARLGRRLPHPPIMGFHPHDDLLDIMAQCDLYVHASDAESEAISCIEAFSCGLVPVISDSPKSATSQFALDDRSLFAAGSSASLTGKIDWWLCHPKERAVMEKHYADYGKRFNLTQCARQLEEMFKLAIADFNQSRP